MSDRCTMRATKAALLLLAFLSASPPVRLTAQDYRAQALRILKTVPLIDGHNDLADAIRARGGLDSVDVAVLQPKLMSDIPKLRAGGVGAQFWAAYVPVTTIDSGPHPAVYALEQIDLIKRLCAKYPRDLAMARTAADVERNFKAGKISCLIGIEGGHAIENSLGALRMFAALGVRYITLTHWRSLSWATASTDTARRPLGVRAGRGARDEPAGDRRRSLPRQRRNDVGRAPHDARSRHVFALLGPRAHRPRAGRAGFDPQARAEERRDRHGEFQPRLRVRGGAAVRGQHGSPDPLAPRHGSRPDDCGRFDEGVGGARPEGDARAGGGSHRAHPRCGRHRCRRARLRLRWHHRSPRGARGRVEVSRSDRRALAPGME